MDFVHPQYLPIDRTSDFSLARFCLSRPGRSREVHVPGIAAARVPQLDGLQPRRVVGKVLEPRANGASQRFGTRVSWGHLLLQ